MGEKLFVIGKTLFVSGVKELAINDVKRFFSKYGEVHRITKPNRDRRIIQRRDICFVHYQSASECKAAYEAGEEMSGTTRRRHYLGKHLVDVDFEFNPKYKVEKQTQVYIAKKKCCLYLHLWSVGSCESPKMQGTSIVPSTFPSSTIFG